MSTWPWGATTAHCPSTTTWPPRSAPTPSATTTPAYSSPTPKPPSWPAAKVEVHLSNIFAREDYRHHSLVTSACRGMICGLGLQGYDLAVQSLLG
ncbi:MAG: type II 3-dehydroquinate dehydratase [Bacteroidales bacterium]|nr:type II 3-dehydroquinate dehydratase [Bacteroidales bacterium]